MKKALLLFTKQSIDRHEADAEALIAALSAGAQEQGISMTFSSALYDNLLHIVLPEGKTQLIDVTTGIDIADYDVVYQRRWGDMPDQALACAIYLKKKGVPFLDAETDRAGSKNKLTQSWRLWEADLPFPATVYGVRGTVQDWIVAHIDTLPFGFPMIMKGLEATRGSDNYLVHSVQELQEKLAAHPTVEFLLQEFIPNDCDYRVIVTGDKISFVMRRIAASGTHTNNTSQGGRAELVNVDELSENVQRDCIRAAAIFSRNFAGVDLVYHKETGAHAFFEVNRSPQIDSGKYVPEKAAILARYLKEVSDERKA